MEVNFFQIVYFLSHLNNLFIKFLLFYKFQISINLLRRILIIKLLIGRNNMQKNPLIIQSIAISCIIVFASFTNVIGIHTVKSVNPEIINDKMNKKDLLFQTILDIANNKDIQKLIFHIEMTKKRSFDPIARFSFLTPPVLTNKFLNIAYNIGLVLSKTISTSKIHSILERYKINCQDAQKNITTILEKDSVITREINQLSISTCGCESENTTVWNFPALCLFLLPIIIFFYFIFKLIGNYHWLIIYLAIVMDIGSSLHCFWTW